MGSNGFLPGLRVALVHDWLTGMRGGEKVLEELCALLPEAPIYTLFHFPGAVSHGDRVAPDPHQLPAERAPPAAPLPQLPAALSPRDRAVRPLRLRSGALDQPLRGQGCAGAAGRPPRLLLPHADALRLGPAHAYFPSRDGAVDRVRHRVLDALQHWDVRASSRVDTFVANSPFVRDRIRRYYGRDATWWRPPVDVEYFQPGPEPTTAPSAGAEALPSP